MPMDISLVLSSNLPQAYLIISLFHTPILKHLSTQCGKVTGSHLMDDFTVDLALIEGRIVFHELSISFHALRRPRQRT
jgi:hypothetical protein